MLNPLPLSKEILPLVDNELQFLGDIELRDDVAALIASGQVHPVTLESYDWKKVAAAFQEEQRFCLPPNPSARSMTSTESVVEMPDASRPDYDANASQPDVSERDAPLRRQTFKRKQNASRQEEDREQPKRASTSWSHLDSVLGTSIHILNFRSPKVSDNFKPLVSLSNRASVLLGSSASTGLKEFENRPVRETVQRVKNPVNRRRGDKGSGFEGEVSCRIDASRTSLSERAELHGDPTPVKNPRSAVQSAPGVPSSAIPSESLRRPFPFGFQNNPQRHEHLSSSSSSGESGSELLWALQSCQQKPRAPSEYSSYSRAAHAEEKWDRILGAELDGNSESGSSQTQLVHSESNASGALETGKTVASS